MSAIPPIRPESFEESLPDRLGRIERQLTHIEHLVAALAARAGIDAGQCRSCEDGRLQYTVDKTRRTFGVVRPVCDTCEDEPAGQVSPVS